MSQALEHCAGALCGDLRSTPCSCSCRGCKAAKRRARRQVRFEKNAIAVEQAIGLVVSKVRRDTVEGTYGPEPRITIYFKGGKHTGFILPIDEEG